MWRYIKWIGLWLSRSYVLFLGHNLTWHFEECTSRRNYVYRVSSLLLSTTLVTMVARTKHLFPSITTIVHDTKKLTYFKVYVAFLFDMKRNLYILFDRHNVLRLNLNNNGLHSMIFNQLVGWIIMHCFRIRFNRWFSRNMYSP